jgi:hypothetical protein
MLKFKAKCNKYDEEGIIGWTLSPVQSMTWLAT